MESIVSPNPHKHEVQLVQGTQWNTAAWSLLLVVSGALFLDGIDLSMVNIALPSIGAELHMPASSLQWIVNAYILGYGGFLLLGGRAADLLGRRQVFLTAVGIFGFASIISAFIDNEMALIVLRFVKGISAGFTVPAGMSIVATSFAEGPARAKALTIYSVIGTLGFALGLVLGGVLTGFGWRVTFFVPGPIALIILFFGWRLIPRVRRNPVSLSQFDMLGAFTMTGALLLLVYTLVEAPVMGWFSVSTLTMLATSVALILAFIIMEKRQPHPLVRLGILRNASLVHANIAAALMLGSFMAFQFVITLYLQNSLNWSPLQVALAFLPSSLPVTILGPRMGALFVRRGTTVPILIGLTCITIAFGLLMRIEPGMSYWTSLLPTMLLTGIGFAFGFPAVNVQATQGVIANEQGLASGLLNTSLQIGGAISLALVAGVLSAAHSPALSGQLLPNMQLATLNFVGIAFIGILITLPRVLKGRMSSGAKG